MAAQVCWWGGGGGKKGEADEEEGREGGEERGRTSKNRPHTQYSYRGREKISSPLLLLLRPPTHGLLLISRLGSNLGEKSGSIRATIMSVPPKYC